MIKEFWKSNLFKTTEYKKIINKYNKSLEMKMNYQLLQNEYKEKMMIKERNERYELAKSIIDHINIKKMKTLH